MHKLLVRACNIEVREVLFDNLRIVDFRVRVKRPIRVLVNEITHVKIATETHCTRVGKMLANNTARVTIREVKCKHPKASHNAD